MHRNSVPCAHNLEQNAVPTYYNDYYGRIQRQVQTWRSVPLKADTTGKKSMHYWLMKSEPSETSIDDVIAMAGKTVAWYGIRNYQARNFMRDQMCVGDGVLFYHSSCAVPGIAGLAQVVSTPYPDATQFDSHSKYFDPKSQIEEPRWILVDIKVSKKTRLISLAELREHAVLSDMLLLQRGNRLSITPVTAAHWRYIHQLMQNED